MIRLSLLWNFRLPFTATAILVVSLLGTSISAAPNRQVDEYFVVRDKAVVVSKISPEAIQTMPDQFTGKLIEIRGHVTAIAPSESLTTLLIVEEGQSLPRLLSIPQDKKVSDWPFLDVGIGIRALCRVVKLGKESGSLELVIPVKEFEAAQLDVERAKAEAALKAALEARRKSEPKGKLSDADLIEIYGQALQHLNRGLADSDAQFLAERIIAESREKRLDARLFVAVVAMEGTFQRALFLDRGVYLGNQTARTAIARIGTDLSRRLDRAMLEKGKQNTALGRALAARRRDLTAGKKPSRAEVERYVNGALRLWSQMSGGDVDSSVTFYSEAPDYEAKWRTRKWVRPPGSMVGTWEAAGGSIIAVLNGNGTGVLGLNGEEVGRWYVSGPYLEFRCDGGAPRRFRWTVSDDRKALTLVRIDTDSTPIRTVTMLRR